MKILRNLWIVICGESIDFPLKSCLSLKYLKEGQTKISTKQSLFRHFICIEILINNTRKRKFLENYIL